MARFGSRDPVAAACFACGEGGHVKALCPHNKYRIYVGAISPQATQAELSAVFGGCWKGRADPYANFGFINAAQEAERDQVLAQNGRMLHGWALRVEESRPRSFGSSSPRPSVSSRSSGYDSFAVASSSASDRSAESNMPRPVGLNPVTLQKPKFEKLRPEIVTEVVPTEFQLCVRGLPEDVTEREVMMAFQADRARLVSQIKPFAFLTYGTVGRASAVLNGYKAATSLTKMRGQAVQLEWERSTKAYLDQKVVPSFDGHSLETDAQVPGYGVEGGCGAVEYIGRWRDAQKGFLF